jgi:hypothetical protein
MYTDELKQSPNGANQANGQSEMKGNMKIWIRISPGLCSALPQSAATGAENEHHGRQHWEWKPKQYGTET